MTTPATGPTWQSLRTLGLTLTTAPVVITVAMWFVLGSEEDAFSPPLWALLVPLVLLLGSLTLINVVGYRAGSPEMSPVAFFQQQMIIRFVFAEAPFIVSLALAFVVHHGGFAVVAIGAAGALVLLWWHVVPNEAQVQRLQRAMTTAGQGTDLRAALHGS